MLICCGVAQSVRGWRVVVGCGEFMSRELERDVDRVLVKLGSR
jgi:hypothetical protein